MPVYSPFNGLELEPTEINGVYKDSIYGMEYIVNGSVVTKISSPASGGSLVRNADGTYSDPYIGQIFSFDDKRNAFIPHYIPDETVEPAHIEGNCLVGNNTGRRFEIDDNGRILTAEEISHQVRQGEDLARIQKMQDDGTIDAFLKSVKTSREKAQQELEQMRKDGTLNDYFASLLNDEETKSAHILEDFDDIIENLGSQSVETLDELLTYFNVGQVKVGKKHILAYSDPVIASKINARYRVLTGNDHPVFLERVPAVIAAYMKSKESLIKVGGYFNEQYFSDLANIQTYINSISRGKQQEETSQTLREYHQLLGIDFNDEYYEINGLREKASKGEINSSDLKKLCDIAFGENSKEAQLVYDSMISSGRVAEPPTTEDVKAK